MALLFVVNVVKMVTAHLSHISCSVSSCKLLMSSVTTVLKSKYPSISQGRPLSLKTILSSFVFLDFAEIDSHSSQF